MGASAPISAQSQIAKKTTEGRDAPKRRDDVLQTDPEARPMVCVISAPESEVGRLAVSHLERDGFAVRTIPMGSCVNLMQRIEHLHPSLVIVEAAMSKQSERRLCRSFRRDGTPVILLATKASEEDRILGLEAGADDYITESSSGREIVARVRAVIRRFERARRHSGVPRALPLFFDTLTGTRGPTIRTGDIEINATEMRILVCGREITTTNLEFRLLYYLAHNQARVFARDQLLDAVWGRQNNVELRSVDACVLRLRRKIEPDPLRPTYLKTVRGAGYCLRAAA